VIQWDIELVIDEPEPDADSDSDQVITMVVSIQSTSSELASINLDLLLVFRPGIPTKIGFPAKFGLPTKIR